jgi:hypothetical protein
MCSQTIDQTILPITEDNIILVYNVWCDKRYLRQYAKYLVSRTKREMILIMTLQGKSIKIR